MRARVLPICDNETFSKKAGGRLGLSLYVFLHTASAGPGGGDTCPPPPRIGRECPKNSFRALYDIVSINGNGLGWFGGGLGCFGVFQWIARRLR